MLGERLSGTSDAGAHVVAPLGAIGDNCSPISFPPSLRYKQESDFPCCSLNTFLRATVNF